jgi:hypothetical protein
LRFGLPGKSHHAEAGFPSRRSLRKSAMAEVASAWRKTQDESKVSGK